MGSRPRLAWSEHCMPDLLESPDAGRGNRELTTAIVPDELAPSASSGIAVPQLAPRAGEPCAAPVLLFQHVSKWYGPVIGINQVTLELRPGITGLVGHNGSGKSTLLRLAAGQIRPDLGNVQIA